MAVLDDAKFKQLDALLDQTTLYSKFLTEQMDSLDEVRAAPTKARTNVLHPPPPAVSAPFTRLCPATSDGRDGVENGCITQTEGAGGGEAGTSKDAEAAGDGRKRRASGAKASGSKKGKGSQARSTRHATTPAHTGPPQRRCRVPRPLAAPPRPLQTLQAAAASKPSP